MKTGGTESKINHFGMSTTWPVAERIQYRWEAERSAKTLEPIWREVTWKTAVQVKLSLEL